MGSFKLGEKEIKVPVIQGGMGIGISLGNLAGTVAREGGIGLISAAQIGFLEPDFEENPLEANLRAIESQLRKARNIAPDGIVGFNIMTAMRDYEKYVGHLRNFKKGEIENFIANNGFKKIKTFYAGFPFYSPLGRDWLNRNYKGYDESVSGNFTKKQKLFHYMLYILFRYFCFRNIGDSFVGLFEKF